MAPLESEFPQRRRIWPVQPPGTPRIRRHLAAVAGICLLAWIGTAGTPLWMADETPSYADMGNALAHHDPGAADRAAELVRIVHGESDRQRLDPRLVMGVIAKESAFRVDVRNRSDLGLMQLSADWHLQRVLHAGGRQALMGPRPDIRAGTGQPSGGADAEAAGATL